MAESKFSIIFSDLTDPRVDRTKRHKLLDIIGLTITAVLCGAETKERKEENEEARLKKGIFSKDLQRRITIVKLPPAKDEWYKQIKEDLLFLLSLFHQTSSYRILIIISNKFD